MSMKHGWGRGESSFFFFFFFLGGEGGSDGMVVVVGPYAVNPGFFCLICPCNSNAAATATAVACLLDHKKEMLKIT